jgi:hypothetical protein
MNLFLAFAGMPATTGIYKLQNGTMENKWPVEV